MFLILTIKNYKSFQTERRINNGLDKNFVLQLYHEREGDFDDIINIHKTYSFRMQLVNVFILYAYAIALTIPVYRITLDSIIKTNG